MYGDVRIGDVAANQPYQGDSSMDGMPAVEVVELANGETIW